MQPEQQQEEGPQAGIRLSGKAFMKGFSMQSKEITEILAALNGGGTDLGFEEENIWYSRKPEWAAFTEDLISAVKNRDIRGSILVATDSDVIFASGSRSGEVNGRTVTPATTYEIGSVTKMHTAVCVFRLIDGGKLRPGDRVTQYFPEYEKAGDMTVFDLLHMRSGIVDFANDPETFFGSPELAEALDEGGITDEILLDHLYQLDLTFVPGSRMEYCNTNYVLLAMILEKITGKAYKEVVSEMVFSPAGMTASSAATFGDVTSVPESKAGYMKELVAARGAGDIHSSAIDLLKFDRAFFSGQRIVSPAARAGILSFVDDYGCGWERSARYEDLVLHDGDTNSYSCLNAVFHASADRKYFIMLACCNRDDDDEETDGSTAENEEANGEEEFNQFQAVFDICKKYLQ